MLEAIIPLSCTPWWRSQGQLYVCYKSDNLVVCVFPEMLLFRLLKLEGRLSTSHLRMKSSFTHSYCIADDCLRVVKRLHDWLSTTGRQRNSWCNVLCEGRRTKVVLCLELLIVPWDMQKCFRSTHRLLLLCFISDKLLTLYCRYYLQKHVCIGI